ncbi:hypothetical protein GOV04_05810 [Candidatus Woesearchaeota archaeon]|nr:hypothetical protein [Candidatus Woesearchaeota archaeon]
MDNKTVEQYYSRPQIAKAIFEASTKREVAFRFGDKGFGKRPDTIEYPTDVIELAKQGVSSFHVSEEHWKNVHQVSPTLKKKELENLRSGWDLVLDIDCEHWDYSKACANLLVGALKHHGVKSISVKFSGNKGFHIGVPFKAFPDKVQDVQTRLLFPEGARRVAEYLAVMIKKHLAEAILKIDDLDAVIGKTGKPYEELVVNGEFNPYAVLDIDTVLISSRHLYRMPYSFHEKSGLVSVPINPDKIMNFDKSMARPQIVSMDYKFLDTSNTVPGEASKLLVQAFDYKPEVTVEEKKNDRVYEDLQEAIPEQLFPPCVNLMLAGMNDGKKRSLFILTNFLSSCGWDYEQIEKRLLEWNKKNAEPLRQNILISHLRYHKRRKEKILPPNCDNKAYYVDMRFCKPDNLCNKIKNPVQYAKRKKQTK